VVLQQPGSHQRDADEVIPAEVDLILSAMDVGQSFAGERRRASRLPLRRRASLKLYADPADANPRTIFTRDADARGMGFITPDLLPLGYGGWVTVRAPNGDVLQVECTVYRCRKTVEGWYEGALNFHRQVWQLG